METKERKEGGKERRKQRSEKRGPGWSERQENARILPATPKCAHA